MPGWNEYRYYVFAFFPTVPNWNVDGLYTVGIWVAGSKDVSMAFYVERTFQTCKGGGGRGVQLHVLESETEIESLMIFLCSAIHF